MTPENQESKLDNNIDSSSLEDAEKLKKPSEKPEDKISSNENKTSGESAKPNLAVGIQTDQAVDDIMQHESDEVLVAEDSKQSRLAAMRPKNLEQKIIDIFHAWWDNKRLRYGTLGGLVVLIILLAILPPSRDFALNTVGFRASALINVTDKATGLPLEDVHINLGGQKASTNNSGAVLIKHVRLGDQKLMIQKVAFATITKKVSIGMGQKNLGRYALNAVGVRYSFVVTDYLSGKPIALAQAKAGQADAVSDQNGKISLTALNSKTSTLSVTVSASNYNNATINVPVGSSAVTAVQLVPAGKEIYVSNSTGRYDVYKSDINGQNKQLLLAGTGNENSNISLVVSPDDKEAALVSTRDNMRDSDGFLLSALTVINVNNGSALTIDHSEQMILLGWSGTKLIYEETAAGASAANSSRERLMSYDYAKNARFTLATANSFNGATYSEGAVYYAVSSTDPSAQADFFKINPDGTNKQTLLSQEVWTIFQTNYTTFALQTANAWYSYTSGAKQATQSSPPANSNNYYFVDNESGTESLWTDVRDGKGVLLVHKLANDQDTTLASLGGLTDPVRWLNDSVAIFRISTPQETADYAASINGGAPKKIVDVIDATGFNNSGY